MTSTRALRIVGLPTILLIASAILLAAPARADQKTDADTLLSAGARALEDGRPGDAISSFEALADRGVLDPAVSYDRGLAYAQRVRVGGEQPGDLGRAAQGFEEARELTSDAKLEKDASRALQTVRAEVARRRKNAGESIDVDATGIGRTLVHLASEDAWFVLAAGSSLGLAAALFVFALAKSRQARVGAAIGWATLAPLLVVFAVMSHLARSDRLHLRQGVMITAGARPGDERGFPIRDSKTFPEAALVDILESRGDNLHVTWGSLDGWVPARVVRPLAYPE